MKKLNLFAASLFAAALSCGAADVIMFDKANKVADATPGDTGRYVFVQQENLPLSTGSMYQIGDCASVKINEDGTVSFSMNKVSTLRIHSNLDKKPFFGKKGKLTMTAVSDKDAEVKLFFEGGINGNHFWRAKDYSLKAGQPVDMSLEETLLPDNVKPTDAVKDMSLWIRFDVMTPGAVITVKNFSMTTLD